MTKTRCAWVPQDNQLYIDYHDKEWGVPVHDDTTLFEFLILEGAQAGLSWSTILNKREGYKKAFANFDPKKVARFSPAKQDKLREFDGIVRNRLKIAATVTNAKAFLEVQKEFGSFDKFIWDFVGGKPIVNKWKSIKQVPATTPLAEKISKDLKSRGFKFIGPIIIYAYMQAVGLVNDHTTDCFRYQQILQTY
jgi:DNA-3-methyladenine glycosylase I